jgi:integral membrane protein (TIGR01906 family)
LSRPLTNIIFALIVLAMPVFLVLSVARVLIADWYPRYEYAKADFPLDPYGFTQSQRIDLALVSIHYLQRPEPPQVAIEMLKAQRLPGADRPLFDQYELSHMIDVKRLTDALWKAHVVAGLVVIAGLILLLAWRKTRLTAYNALLYGGGFTALLLVGLVLFVLFSWREFFITFHDIFFSPGTWTFDWSNSLIRLFPDKFWFDAGTILTVGSLLLGLLVALVGYVLIRVGRRPDAHPRED